MTITTALTQKLGIDHPLILAPMAGVSGGRLAASVSSAGGLGLIGGGYGDREWVEREFAASGNTPVGIGFITWKLLENPDLLRLALDRGPKAVMLSFGRMGGLASEVKRAGTVLIAQIQTLDQARAALDDGADVLVAQGTEAGGHGGMRATLPLVPAVCDIAGETPVVAAGGIADGRGLAAALMLGAAGALCGTAFFAAEEALSHVNAKKAALAASGDETERGTVFDIARGLNWPGDWNLRTLRNSYLDEWRGRQEELKRSSDKEMGRYARAAAQGDTEVAAVIVGEAVDMVTSVEPAADIVKRIVAGAEERLRTGFRLIAEA